MLFTDDSSRLPLKTTVNVIGSHNVHCSTPPPPLHFQNEYRLRRLLCEVSHHRPNNMHVYNRRINCYGYLPNRQRRHDLSLLEILASRQDVTTYASTYKAKTMHYLDPTRDMPFRH